MKIAWFTPLSKFSGISRFSQSVVETLKNKCQIDVWTTDYDNCLKTDFKKYVYKSSDNIDDVLRSYDMIFYNFGNNLLYHKDMYEVSKRVKGVIILHDFIVHNFFVGYYFEYKRNINEYIKKMNLLYGKKGKITALKSISNKKKPIWESDSIIHYPFFEEVISNAYGVITHSKYTEKLILKKNNHLVNIIKHPYYYYKNLNNNIFQTTKKNLGIELNKKIIITLGHVNSNKKIDKLIKLLGTNKNLAEKIIYFIIGPFYKKAKYYRYLVSLIEKYHLKKVVKLLGFQTDEMIYRYLNIADLCINLRSPSFESASGSLIEQMYFGKPVIVENKCFYKEIPNNCVIKIKAKSKNSDFKEVLNSLVKNDKYISEIGENARKLIREHYTPEGYSNKLLLFCNQIIKQKPIFDLIDKTSEELINIIGTPNEISCQSISNEIYSISKGTS